MNNTKSDIILKIFKIFPEFNKSNKKVVLNEVKLDGLALRFANKCLQNNKKIVLEAVKQNGMALEFASKDLQNNKKIVMIAVAHAGFALRFASKDLQNDKDVVTIAVKNNGVLEFASMTLRDDEEIVFEAVKNTYCAFHFASHRLKHNKDFVLKMAKSGIYILGRILQELNYDKEILLAQLQNFGIDENYPDYIKYYCGSKKDILNYLKIFAEPAKFPFNDTIYPDLRI